MNSDQPAGITSAAETSASANLCSGCHQPLTRRGPQGECLRCLLNFALSQDGPSEAVDNGHKASTSGAQRYGHFDVAMGADGFPVELGAGAMAVTYRARDTILGCDVALKVIDQRVAQHPVARARFLREARAAAQLRHPNVARVTHYGEQDGECYYAMELVEGETLEQLVRRDGTLSVDAALAIITQVTHALAAAEVQGLVHRDLKPSNIMVVTAQTTHKPNNAPVIKVIDFGLAKAANPTGEIAGENDTHQGFVGTPAFASPEQFVREQDGHIDTRSDIYSLGATLWYLLCGRAPFIGRTLEDIYGKQIGQALPIEQLTKKRVPAPVVALLRSMLAVDPADRPQSARELLADLQGCQGRLAFAARWRKTQRWVAAAAVLGLVVLATVMVRDAMRRERAAQATADRSIAVLPFENLSSDPADAFFTTGMQDEITSELALIAQLKVIGADSVKTYPPGPRVVARIGRELGVGHLLEGSVRRSAGTVRIAVNLINLRDRTKDWRNEYERQLSDVFAVQREITGEVANRLRATLSASERTSLNAPPTTDRIAYDLYLRAQQGPTLFKGPAEMLAADNKRLALLEEAVSRDPNFVFAYCQIAEIHDGLEEIRGNFSAEDLAVDHRALAEAALAKARRLKPDEGLVHLAQANHLRVTVRDNAQARLEADLARRTLPNNARLEEIIALIAGDEGRWEEAVRAATRAAELQPRDAALLEDLVLIYRATRRYEDADRASERLLAVKQENERFYQRLFRATGALEEAADLGPLRDAIAAATPADERDAAHLFTYRLLLALCAHDPDAISRALATDPRPRIHNYGFTYPRAWFEALAARMRGGADGAQAAFTAARKDMEELVQADPTDAKRLSMLAVIDAGLGRKEEAVREGQRACEMQPLKKSAVRGPTIACNLAVVYAWTDQPDLAIALLEDLAGQAAGISLLFQPTYGDLRLNPVWDPLRSDPRFAVLIERFAPTASR